jgi:hypothetical protein
MTAMQFVPLVAALATAVRALAMAIAAVLLLA